MHVAAEVWNALGVELSIFALTFIIGHMVQFVANCKFAQGDKQKKGMERGVWLSAFDRVGRRLCFGGAWLAGWLLPGRSSEGCGGSAKNKSTRRARDDATSLDLASVDSSKVRRRQNTQREDAVDLPLVLPEGSSKLVDHLAQACKIKSNEPRACHRALEMYDTLRRDNCVVKVVRMARVPPISFYTWIVQSAISLGDYASVLQFIEDMTLYRVGRTLAFYEGVMKQLAGQKQFHWALEVYERLLADGLEPSAVTCSCLISFAAEVGDFHRAVGFFHKLCALTTPTIRAYMTVLRVFTKLMDFPASVEILRDMQRQGLQIDTLALNVVLATGVAAGEWKAVEDLFDEAGANGLPVPDVVSYNTLLKSHVQQTLPTKALELVARMREQGVIPNTITFNTAMDSLVRGRQAESHWAWVLFNEMRSQGLQPDKFTCSILVKGLAKSASSANVRLCLDVMSESLPRDAGLAENLYNSVLESAISTGDALAVAQVTEEMVHLGVPQTRHLMRMLARKHGTAWKQHKHPQSRTGTSISSQRSERAARASGA